MVLRTLLGTGPADMLPRHTLKSSQVVLAGVRALDPAEKEFVAETGMAHVEVAALSSLSAVVEATGAKAVYIHIDLDVLDPADFTSVGTPEPAGVPPSRLAAAVRDLMARFPVAGVGITEYEPGRPEDREVLAALTRAIFAS
jgi:arginase family enzyme